MNIIKNLASIVGLKINLIYPKPLSEIPKQVRNDIIRTSLLALQADDIYNN